MQSFNRFLPKISIGLVGVALVVLAAIVLTPSPAPAQPVISWVPESVSETILAGETKTVSVSFTASEDLGAVEVRVVPELAPYVSTNPTSFPALVAGQETNIEIIISAAADAPPQTVDGTIQIRNAGQPPRNFAQPLPVIISIRLLPTTPENALRQLAHDLQTNNIQEVLQRFKDSPVNYDSITELDSDDRGRFATALMNSRPLEETNVFSIYLIPWVEDDGSTIELEMMLAKNDSGEWIIISW
jgi:hypothetical protein